MKSREFSNAILCLHPFQGTILAAHHNQLIVLNPDTLEVLDIWNHSSSHAEIHLLSQVNNDILSVDMNFGVSLWRNKRVLWTSKAITEKIVWIFCYGLVVDHLTIKVHFCDSIFSFTFDDQGRCRQNVQPFSKEDGPAPHYETKYWRGVKEFQRIVLFDRQSGKQVIRLPFTGYAIMFYKNFLLIANHHIEKIPLWPCTSWITNTNLEKRVQLKVLQEKYS